MNAVEKFEAILKSAQSVAVLTGAGISTASGIPDFRSASGIYSDKNNVNVFDLDAFRRDPALFYNFARDFYPKVRDAKPNAAHHALAEWQDCGKAMTIITQNVDDYHQRAGSSPVYTVHGNFIHSTCQSCRANVETETLLSVIMEDGTPHCGCGGIFKPDITFFGEMLPQDDWEASVQAIRCADLVLVLGSSLTVHPVAMLPVYRPSGSHLVIINRDPTSFDREADLVIHDDLCKIMQAVSCD